MNAIMNKTNNGKRLLAAVAIIAMVVCCLAVAMPAVDAAGEDDATSGCNVTVSGTTEWLYGLTNDKIGNDLSIQEVKDNDFAVLPTVSVNYAPNDAHSLSLSFDMYRNRPVLSTLSPGRQDQSPTIYHENNPDLKSVYGYSGSLMYVCKQHYIFGVNYIGGPMMTDFRQTVDGEYTRIRHETFGHQHFTSLTFSWNDSFFENSLCAGVILCCHHRVYSRRLIICRVLGDGVTCAAAIAGGI